MDLDWRGKTDNFLPNRDFIKIFKKINFWCHSQNWGEFIWQKIVFFLFYANDRMNRKVHRNIIHKKLIFKWPIWPAGNPFFKNIFANFKNMGPSAKMPYPPFYFPFSRFPFYQRELPATQRDNRKIGGPCPQGWCKIPILLPHKKTF